MKTIYFHGFPVIRRLIDAITLALVVQGVQFVHAAWPMPDKDISGSRNGGSAVVKMNLEDYEPMFTLIGVNRSPCFPECPGALTGDVLGDTRSEIVAGFSGEIRVYDASGIQLAVFPTSARLFCLADMDRDGKLDILTSKLESNYDFTLSVQRGDGTVLRSMTIEGTGQGDQGVGPLFAGDCDGDGEMEIVSAGGSGYATRWRGLEVTSYATGQRKWRSDIGPFPYFVRLTTGSAPQLLCGCVGVWNGRVGQDGSEDCASYIFSWSAGNGQALWRRSFNYGGFYDAGLYLPDLNGDGTREIVAIRSQHGWNVSDFGTGVLSVLDPATGAEITSLDTGHYLSLGGACGDLDGVAGEEIVVGTIEGTSPYLRSYGTGFTPKGDFSRPSGQLWLAAVADLTGDGNAEVLAVHASLEGGCRLLILDGLLRNVLKEVDFGNGHLTAFADDCDLNGRLEIFGIATDASGNAKLTVLGSKAEIGLASEPTPLTENAGDARLHFRHLAGLDAAASMSYAVTGGTATGGVDFVLPDGVLEFAAGVTNLAIPLTIIDDALVEGTETILLSLTNSASGWSTQVPLTIQDDDTGVEFESATYTVSEGAGQVVLGVRRQDDSTEAATVDYTTVDGTAQAGVDYVTTSGKLTFASGDTYKEIVVSILDDTQEEDAEALTVVLSDAASGGALGSAVQSTVIVQDDELPSNSALMFNGDDAVVVPNTPQLNPQNMTVECWLNLAKTESGIPMMPICKGGDRTSGCYRLILLDGGGIIFHLGEYWNGCSAAAALPLKSNVWYHVAGTYDGNLLKLFVDGIEVASTVVGRVPTGNNAPLYFSFNDVSGFPYYFYGQLDEVRIWNCARDAESIRRDMRRRLTGMESGLVGYWDFNENRTAQTVNDRSPGGSDGSLGWTSGMEASDPRRTASTAPIAFGIWSDPFMLSEVTETGVIVVERYAELDLPARIDYTVTGGTATLGQDFLLPSGFLEFASGITNMSIPVTIIDDALVEAPETILLSLTNSLGGWSTTVPLSIQDDDTGIEMEQVAYTVSEGDGQVVLGVRRVDDSTEAATADYTIVDGTAKAGVDYVTASGKLTFASGDTHKEIVVPMIDDELRELDKAFSVRLSNVVGGSGFGAVTQSTITIQDDDLGSRNYYYASFEGALGPEWSVGNTDVTPIGSRRFLGQFGNDTVSLRLTNLPPHTNVTVSLDLFIIRTWDGNAVTPDGPDLWKLSVAGGPALVHSTFLNGPYYDRPPGTQSFPGNYPNCDYPCGTGATEHNTLGFTWPEIGVVDSVYNLVCTFPHTSNEVVLDFSGQVLEGLHNESWGLDNVSVALGLPPTNTVYQQTQLALGGGWFPATNVAVHKVSASGNRAVALGGDGQIHLLDVASTDSPKQLACWKPAFVPCDAKMSGNLAYIATYELDFLSTVEIVDFSNPTKPVLLGYYDTPGYALELAVQGTVLYVANADGGLLILDVSDPSSPHRLGGFDLKENVNHVQVSGHFAYVAAGTWLVVLDVSDPANPRRVGLYEASGEIVALQPSGSQLYLAEALGDLRILDLTDPRSLLVLGSYRGWGEGLREVVVSSSRAYLARGGSGLQVLDASDPAKPVWLLGTPWGQEAEDVAVVGNRVLVAGGEQGLKVYELQQRLYPPLKPVLSAGGWMTLTWPVTEGVRLQMATNLTNPKWIDLPESETTNSLQLATPPGNAFFRLVKRPKVIWSDPRILAGPITSSVDGHVYYLLVESSWTEAEATAESFGGTLAIVDDQAENDWIYSTFSRWEGSPRVLWIGLTDAGEEGKWRWVTDKQLAYSNWGAGEPNNAAAEGENYGCIFSPGDPRAPGWNDYPDDVWQELTTNGVVEVAP